MSFVITVRVPQPQKCGWGMVEKGVHHLACVCVRVCLEVYRSRLCIEVSSLGVGSKNRRQPNTAEQDAHHPSQTEGQRYAHHSIRVAAWAC